MSGLAILLTTTDSEEKAGGLARAALEARLAACVQVFPVRSHYVWQAEMCEEIEYLVQMKTRGEDYVELAALVRRLHSYDTPEILRIDVADADPAYFAWALAATARS
jgi:periplasmic divalent cation tolerance protein